MSRTSIHVNPELEGEVVGALEEAGFDIEVGNGPMVDFVIDEKEIDGIILSDEAPERWKPLPADSKPDQLSEDEFKGGYTHKKDDVEVRIFGTTSDSSGHSFSHETVLDDATEQQRYHVYRIYHPDVPEDRLVQSSHSGFEGDFEAAKEKAHELALEYTAGEAEV